MQNTLYTRALYPYDALFSPTFCGGLSLKNRIIAVPPDGLTPLRAERFALEVAAGGAGLVCTELLGLCEKIRKLGSRAFYLTKGKRLDAAAAMACDGICLDLRDMPIGKAVKAVKNARRTLGEGLPVMCMVSVTKTNIAGLDCLAWAGADMLCVEPCADAALWLRRPTEGMPAGCFLELARLAKLSINIPIAACGKLGYPDTAEAALRGGACDAIVLRRTLLADPDWCIKAQAGTVDDVIPYINPEGRLLAKTCTAETKKRIAVIGGGLTGMSFALCAANRGHAVELFESGARLGGRLYAEQSLDTLGYRRWLVLKLCRSENVQIYLNSYVDATQLIKSGCDAVVYANGTRLRPEPDIPNWGDIPFAPLWVLASGKRFPAHHIAILGGGREACKLALRLKNAQPTLSVTLLEESSDIMTNAPLNEREWFRKALETQGIELMTLAVPARISEGCLLVRQNCSAALGKAFSTETFIRSVPCDLIVLAQDEIPDTSQYKAARSELPDAPLYCLTGSFSPCDIVPITRAAYGLAQRI